ncbi:MAG: MFS transporter [Sphingobacteriales bacterium]|nr:MFS transporter [Sphingobacteriales bacterium]
MPATNSLHTDKELQKPALSFSQIINLSIGFLGVQYAFGLQQAYMSPIYRYLGVEEHTIPLLWLAGPITGLVIQPIVGAMSDSTWTPLGRRRPYILVGAIFTSLALVLMPQSSALWMAASLMWLLDGMANVTMEPFRALVGDKLPVSQRSLGFAVQSFFVGFGQVLATTMVFILPLLGVAVSDSTSELQKIPDYVKYPFWVGAVVLLLSVLWTFFTTKEEAPQNPNGEKEEGGGFLHALADIGRAFKEMPRTMRQLWWVKFFTWYGLPLMWQYLGLSIARHVYQASNQSDAGFAEGIKMGGLGLTMFNIGCVVISILLPFICRYLSQRAAHALCLSIGGLAFITMLFTNDIYVILAQMLLVGIAWGSIMSMPYAMLCDAIPAKRMGVYMGIFNMFIVIPQIINMITIPFIYKSVLQGDPRNALVLAGICLLLAAVACFAVDEKQIQAA